MPIGFIPPVVLLVLALLIGVIYLVSLRRDICGLTERLDCIEKHDTMMRLVTQTRDREVVALALKINGLLDRHQSEQLTLRRKDAQLRQALTNISHDLRTPLTSAVGYLQLMEDPALSEAQRLAYATVVRTKLDTLTQLIDQLFAFTQLVEGEDAPLERVNLASVVRDILASYYDDFTHAGFVVEASISEQPVSVIANEDAVRRIVQNLLGNALSHGVEWFSVHLEAGDEGQPDGEGQPTQLTITNRLTEPEALVIDQLFNRFYTADVSRTTKSTGLGLAIVKLLVEQMDGSVSATLEGNTLAITVLFK
ncbi:MAG: HAMP domain-containing histidine kinase [Coriobacteriales bacterium]|jgi:signal transduction histidine kinase|nr:HAMP domain-containing histidine kinase [Coriobacteriales bacterium]